MKMFKSLALIAALLGASVLLSACDKFPGQYAKFGNYGGGPRPKSPADRFQPDMVKAGMRWFPAHVDFGPDGDTLLVSLCHVQRNDLCRIGKYSITKKTWEILPFEEQRTYLTPIFSPDGQWIVATTVSTNEERLLDYRDYRLVKMRPDGSGMESVKSVDSYWDEIPGFRPSFSADGKKLIYWRRHDVGSRVKHEFTETDLFMVDWGTGKETRLTQLGFLGQEGGRPYLTPNGEQFLFSGALYAMYPSEFTKHNALMIASVKDAPITGKDLGTKATWPWEDARPRDMDGMDRQGRVLYFCGLGAKKRAGNAVALSIRPREPDFKPTPRPRTANDMERKNPFAELTEEQIRRGDGARLKQKLNMESDEYRSGEGSAAFLRRPLPNSKDEVVFDGGSSISSPSPDGSLLAFITGTFPPAADETTGVGLIPAGKPRKDTEYIDWPRLDLTPHASHPSTAKP